MPRVFAAVVAYRKSLRLIVLSGPEVIPTAKYRKLARDVVARI